MNQKGGRNPAQTYTPILVFNYIIILCRTIMWLNTKIIMQLNTNSMWRIYVVKYQQRPHGKMHKNFCAKLQEKFSKTY